jgi:acetolactate synthase-1/2/3 large subunit
MNGAELFVRCLENEQVEYIFGVPGEENAHFMMALEDSPIKFILCRHEQGAAFMADVYGRLTGKPGVCLGTLGPGATNLVTGVADGNMDRAPMVVITGQVDSRRQHKESHQNMDVVSMFKPITKWTQPVIHSKNIPEIVRKAFKLATAEKSGACHIELADDIAGFAATGAPLRWQKQKQSVAPPAAVAEAAELIQGAVHPVILAGNGVIRNRASSSLREFARQTGIGVINTFMGKGVVPRTWPESLFTIGLQAQDHILCCLQQADLVIAIGYDLVEYAPQLWSSDCYGGDGRQIIHIDCLPAEADEYYQVDLELVGDLTYSLSQLTDQLAEAGYRADIRYREAIRRLQLVDLDEHRSDCTEGVIKPQKVLADVREVMGPDDIVLSDVGAHKMWIARYYQCDEPNTCLISNGFCSMGFALPGAIGAKLVHPDRRVLAICGDGGFLMNVQEMETALRVGANIVVMVWEDKAYGLIEWKQKNSFGTHSDLSFANPDFNQLAAAFGWHGIRVEKSDDLQPALEEAFRLNRPVLLSLPIDYRENMYLSKKLGAIACPI